MNQALMMEFDHEMAITRKALERVPDGKLAWKPHEKSMTMGQLASHLAELPSWTIATIREDKLDVAPPGGPAWEPFKATSTASALATFDKNVAGARAALAEASDGVLMQPWSLLKGGVMVMTMPKIACLRGFIFNHNVHHRAQLGLYLRLNDVPVPSTYGPSADEGGM
jgi:uncharacterized damage-inducible protein DinB